jgi:uncharacterized protein
MMKTKPQAKKAKTTKQARTEKAMKATAAKGTLSVTGEGEIRVRPDIALIDIAVVTNAKNAQQAVQQNAERSNRVIDSLKDAGIRAADIQSVGFDVIPLVDSEQKSPTFGQILEYRVVAHLRIRVSVEEAGETIDASVRAGANLVSGVRYTVRDEAGVRERALKAAVRAARRDADAVADSLAIKLREPEQVEINMGNTPVFFRETMMAKAAATTPIEPGTIEIRATVRVVYRYS